MAKNRNFNLGKIDKIRYKSPSRSWSIKVPKPRRDGLNYCEPPIPSSGKGVLANLARKIPNADVFAYYKSAYNRWTKALGRYPEYEETSVIDDIPYRNFYFKSCKSFTGFWEVKYRDDGQLEFGVDVNTDGDNVTTLDLSDLLNGLNSQTISCDGTASIIKDGETIQLNGDVQVIDHPEQILCENGSCTEGLVYLPVTDPLSVNGTQLGYIQYPVSPESEMNGQVYQTFGSNIFYQLDTELINPTIECNTNCAVSTNYGGSKPYALIEYGGKQYLSSHPPIYFTVTPADGDTYKHTWQLPEGCGNPAESFVTTEPVESYAITEGSESTSVPATENTPYYADKSNAKLTWNSGSIETTNTPISYDLEMRQITIDGVNYQFNKELNNTTPYSQSTLPGGVRVQWSPTDVEMLSGTTWTTTVNENISTNYAFSVTNWRMNNINTGGYNGAFVYSKRLNLVAFRYGLNSFFLGKRIIYVYPPLNINESIYGYVGLEFQDSAGLLYYAIIARTFPSTAPWEMQGMTIQIAETTVLSGTVTNLATPPITKTPLLIRVTTNTGAFSQRTTSINPTVTLTTPTYKVIANFIDSTTQEFYSSTTQPVSITAIKNYLKVLDSTGQLNDYTYTSEPTNFAVSYRGAGWTLNFQPQNISYSYPATCKPFNVVTNTKVSNEGGCCGQKTTTVGGQSGLFDTTGIHNPPAIDCRSDPFTQGNPPQVCYPTGSEYLGFSEAEDGTVTTLYRFPATTEVTDACSEVTHRIDIYDTTGLVRQDTVCGDPTSGVKITTADGVNFTLYVGVDGQVLAPVTYENYDPTSNSALFKIVQLPYQEVIDDSGSQYFPPEYELNYQCTTRYAGGNGPFTVDYFYNETLNKWVVNILDADGNIVGTQYLDSEPAVNDASQTPNINTLNQDPYLTCTCPDHDRKIYYYDPRVKDEGYISDWSGDNSAGAPNILGTRCCKHVFSVLNQLGVAEKYIPEDFPTDPVPEKYQNPALIGDEATSSLRPNDINRFKRRV